jgi:hypothetical protein
MALRRQINHLEPFHLEPPISLRRVYLEENLGQLRRIRPDYNLLGSAKQSVAIIIRNNQDLDMHASGAFQAKTTTGRHNLLLCSFMVVDTILVISKGKHGKNRRVAALHVDAERILLTRRTPF